jgi:hypothetical protein
MHLKICRVCQKEFQAHSKSVYCSDECRLTGYPCPICGVAKKYKYPGFREKLKNSPCTSCSNSIKAGGKGNIKERGCINCGSKDLYINSYSLCKTCHNNRSKRYHKEVYRWSKYGLNGPIEMRACEICDDPNDLVIDHCHDTNEFRGVLCRTCNMGIGHLKENKDVIRKAYEYAKRTFK